MKQALLVLINAPDMDAAERIAHHLVEQKLAACVNCLPGVKSVYRWQGAVETATEVSLLVKTTQARFAELEASVKSMHPYQVPEIIGLPITAGLPAYLDWILKETE